MLSAVVKRGTGRRADLGFAPQGVQEVDLMERQGSEVRVSQRSMQLAFAPFEIKTLRVRK